MASGIVSKEFALKASDSVWIVSFTGFADEGKLEFFEKVKSISGASSGISLYFCALLETAISYSGASTE